MKIKLNIFIFTIIILSLAALCLSLCRYSRQHQTTIPIISSYRLAQAEINNGNYARGLELIDQYFRDVFEQSYLGCQGVLRVHAMPVWKQLNGQYPPSRERMECLVEELVEYLRTGEIAKVVLDPKYLEQMNPQGNLQIRRELILAAVADYCFMFQEELGQKHQAVELFEHLIATEPAVAKRIWPSASNLVFTAKRYDLAIQYVQNWERNCYNLLDKIDKAILEDPVAQRVYQRNPKYYTGLSARQLRHFLDLGVYLGQTEKVHEIVKIILARGDFEERPFIKYLSTE